MTFNVKLRIITMFNKQNNTTIVCDNNCKIKTNNVMSKDSSTDCDLGLDGYLQVSMAFF